MIDYKSQSLANQVYETIERNILNGVYSKGAVISEMKLSEELGVSRTPIREAMTRLETERLIETTSTGTIVVGISDKDVKDMFENLDKSKYEEIISLTDSIDELIVNINSGIELKDYSKFEEYNKKGNELYSTYAMWLIKPEI